MATTPDPPLNPRQLFHLFDGGVISREELQAAMSAHAERLIDEMEDTRRNPAQAYLDDLLSRQAAARLARRHGESSVREVMRALADVPAFPPANLLWNANHLDVPLHCFVRTRREPVFRILLLRAIAGGFRVRVEYGARRRHEAVREEFTLQRDAWGRLEWQTRKAV